MDIINAIIGEEEDLERRLDIRKEFVQMGIIELIDVRSTDLVEPIAVLTHCPFFRNYGYSIRNYCTSS
jgi:hypothetical protein